MIQLPVHQLLDAFQADDLPVERRTTATSTNVYGEPQVAAPVTTSQRIMVHQATRKQVERAGLDHLTDWRAFYSDSELRVADSTGPGHVVQYQGERWELMDLADYNQLGGMWLALGKRIE